MAPDGFVGLAAGAVGLGVAHGVEPGHGWPVAATYALDRANAWLAGLVAGLVIGVGHLISSVAVVVAFFWAKSVLGLAEVGWMNYVAGGLLVLLGLREARRYYRDEGHHGHDHAHGNRDRCTDDHRNDRRGTDDRGSGRGADGSAPGPGHGGRDAVRSRAHGHGAHHDHAHGAHGHGDHHTGGTRPDHAHHEHAHGTPPDHAHDGGLLARLWAALSAGGHARPEPEADRGLAGLAAFAFALGFAHEEEFEIIAICLGSRYCLELMLAYALAVVAGIVGLTLLLVAGYERFEERIDAYAPYLPLVSAAVLVAMGIGFVVGAF